MMEDAHDSASRLSWPRNLDLQRRTGFWIGDPPFKLKGAETVFTEQASKGNGLQTPTAQVMRRRLPEAFGTSQGMRRPLEAKPSSSTQQLKSDIPPRSHSSRKPQVRKVERQKERRREKREQGDEWRGRRDSVEDRIYSKAQKDFIAQSHVDWANRADTKGESIPLRELTQRFNEHFRESPVRSRSSLASLIGRDGGLSRLRDSLK
ncbi:hypothetical protein CB0940_11893 [Cercospora beticola]|uniref:Uncharacterized protein n=1 Tax=Cercospora beticola TaxID=122368 RepID=A0A2G5IDL3_CERBT|nr:hypothetical protein CB0940_11893 [Cercospora beticola]PIB02865.1 hypothetical protein CB0940_11893 [Cercospora beticola]WPB04252.1 hypothetical protein RHO25_008897 [Cercospora beticola]